MSNDWPEGESYEGFYEKAFAGVTTRGFSSTDESSEVYKGNVTELLKKMADMKPAIKFARAYLIVPPEMTFPELQFVPFEEEQTKSRMWRHNWGDYSFGIPIVRPMYWGVDWAKPEVKEEPVLPRLMAEHVEVEQSRDLSAWQALIFVVVVGTILCLLGGVL